MSAPSMLLLCAGAASSLAGVWTLSGLSESSALRFTPRVAFSSLTGLGAALLLYARAPAELRAELALPLLFGVAAVLALAAGAAKIEAALLEKDGARVVRRAAGIVVGAVLSMAAVGAASLDLSSSSVVHARFGWGFMFAFVAAVLLVFAGRARYAGAGLVALGQRALMLALVAAALLAGARLTVAAPGRPLTLPAPSMVVAASSSDAAAAEPSVEAPARSGEAPAPSTDAPVPSAAAPAQSASAAGSPSPEAPASAAPSVTAPGSGPTPAGAIEIGEITTRGLLEADARGGVMRRMDKLEGCLGDAKNAQHGALALKVGIDASGSVAYIRPTGGELSETPLGVCFLRMFYKMGFAAPAQNNAYFTIVLRVP